MINCHSTILFMTLRHHRQHVAWQISTAKFWMDLVCQNSVLKRWTMTVCLRHFWTLYSGLLICWIKYSNLCLNTFWHACSNLSVLTTASLSVNTENCYVWTKCEKNAMFITTSFLIFHLFHMIQNKTTFLPKCFVSLTAPLTPLKWFLTTVCSDMNSQNFLVQTFYHTDHTGMVSPTVYSEIGSHTTYPTKCLREFHLTSTFAVTATFYLPNNLPHPQANYGHIWNCNVHENSHQRNQRKWQVWIHRD